MPFIEGYGMSGNYDRALEITERVLQNSPTELEALSSLWRRIMSSREPEIKAHKGLWDNLQRLLILSPGNSAVSKPTVVPTGSGYPDACIPQRTCISPNSGTTENRTAGVLTSNVKPFSQHRCTHVQ